MKRLIAILLLTCGCTMTPVEKLKYYGCVYYSEGHGFCCEKEVPEYDQYILNCEYGRLCND